MIMLHYAVLAARKLIQHSKQCNFGNVNNKLKDNKPVTEVFNCK